MNGGAVHMSLDNCWSKSAYCRTIESNLKQHPVDIFPRDLKRYGSCYGDLSCIGKQYAAVRDLLIIFTIETYCQ